MTDDIVARLRSPEVFIDTGGMFSPVAHQAADEIERLREALNDARNAAVDASEVAGEACVRAFATQSEIERLREALTGILDVQYYGVEGYQLENDEMRKIARAALAEEKKDD